MICKYIFISRNIGISVWYENIEGGSMMKLDQVPLTMWKKNSRENWRIREITNRERRRMCRKTGEGIEVEKDWKHWPRYASSINLLDPVIIVDDRYNRYTHDPDT